MDFFASTYFWLGLSFLIFAYIIGRYAVGFILGFLDKRIERVREDLANAENLRVEAQELLAQYQRKHRDAAEEADKIIKRAEDHVEQMKKKAEEDLQAYIARREKQIEERLHSIEEKAVLDIQRYAADLAIKATSSLIAEQLDKKTHDKLIADSVSNISEKLAS